MLIYSGKNGKFGADYRKYGGAWVPVVQDMKTGKRTTSVHVNSGRAAVETAVTKAKELAGEGCILLERKQCA